MGRVTLTQRVLLSLRGGGACVGDACARKLVPGTTWLARPTEFLVRDSSDTWPGDARARRRSHSVGVTSTISRVTPFSPLDPNLPHFAGFRTNS